jgi:hypothetical protein
MAAGFALRQPALEQLITPPGSALPRGGAGDSRTRQEERAVDVNDPKVQARILDAWAKYRPQWESGEITQDQGIARVLLEINDGDRAAALAEFKTYRALMAAGMEPTVRAALTCPGTTFEIGWPEDQ